MARRSLSRKISSNIVIALLVSVAAFIIFVYFIARNTFYQVQRQTAINKAIDEADEVNQIFSLSSTIVQSISNRSEIINFLQSPMKIDPRSIETILNQYNLNNDYSLLYLLNTEGNVLVSTNHALLGNNLLYGNKIPPVVSVKFYFGTITREAGFYFFSPIYGSSSQVIGAVVAKLKPEVISANFISEESVLSEFYAITDLDGVIVNTNDNSLKAYSSFGDLSTADSARINQSQNFPWPVSGLGRNSVQEALKNYSSPLAIEEYNSFKKNNEIVGISQIGNHPFFLVFSSSLSLVDIVIIQNIAGLISGLVFMSIVMFTALNISISRAIKPLSRLTQFAISVSKGNFDQQINLTTGDEFEEVANVFNETTARLKAFYQDLLNQVKTRTSDLSDKIKELELTKKAIFNLLEDAETEKKKSIQQANDLQKFKLAVDSTSDQIAITDNNASILYVNEATVKNTGFTRRELIGQNPSLWGGQMEDNFYQKMWKEIKDKKHSFRSEFTNIRKDKTKYIADVQIHPILDKDNKIIFYVGVERDITKAKEIETMKNDFISVASHQLRTPLGSMRWNLEMLLAGDKGKLSKDVKDTVSEIYGSDTRMITLVNDLLNVSRIDQGRIENIPVQTNLIPIIDESIKEMDYMASQKNVKITFVKDKKEIFAFVDPKRFREVIQNLVSNAVKYNKINGSIKINIAQNSKETNITVSDTGMGISKKDQQRLFTKFFRATNAVLSETEGSGLGLFVVKTFVESWGGSITFTSEENKGSTFYLKLPVKNHK